MYMDMDMCMYMCVYMCVYMYINMPRVETQQLSTTHTGARARQRTAFEAIEIV
jgi:hypothetical protein